EYEEIFSREFVELSEAVVDTLESEYNKIPGVQTVSVILVNFILLEDGVDVFVEIDVGSEDNTNEEQIRSVLYNVVKEGAIASYSTSVQGFQFRRLGVGKTSRSTETGATVTQEFAVYLQQMNIYRRVFWLYHSQCLHLILQHPPPPCFPSASLIVTPSVRPCMPDEHRCGDGTCILMEYLCDNRQDCRDMSDEVNCGTPSPCEPNEFKCKNGRCALKLWRCDGDNDCEDNSDETDCPSKGPDDRCAPEQFECLSDNKCIPASYQCDEEPDCEDRSDEYGCTPPAVTSPPEESVQVARGATVTFTCQAVGVPTPIITWRLNWGHIPTSNRITVTSDNGRGTLIIRDVKESDQGAYTCEAINAKGLVFGIPDGVLTLISNPNPGNCPDGHFSVNGRCLSCFCAGISKNCKSTGRYRNHISLRFTEEENFKGVNVTYPSRPGTPPLSSTQLLINPEMEEFQLVDLSRRFLNLDSFWTLPRQFLGNKIDSYGGSLKFKVRYTLARGLSESVEKPDVMLVGNGHRLVYRRGNGTPPNVVNQKEIRFTEDNWQHSSGRFVTRDELMMTLANLESISIRTNYDNHMVSVALSDIVMDTTTVEFSVLGHAKDVEECRCPPGYTGLSCEMCSAGFERVPGGLYLGTCAGCNCNGHATACDPISGQCLSCQHNTEGPQCDKCRPGYFGDPSRGRPDDCKPCPCPYTETSRRFSDTCFLNIDQQPTCDACRPGYTGRRCEKCAPGYQGNPLLPNGKCVPVCEHMDHICDCVCLFASLPALQNNVAGALCDECKPGFFHLSGSNAEGCLQCFCMGVTKQCSSSTWNREQVGGVNGQLFSLSNSANTNTITEGISQRGSSGVVYRFFSSLPNDIYYWVLPQNFRGDKVTAYGGELRYTVSFEPFQRSRVIDGQPDVVLQGNGIFLEHYAQTRPLPRFPQIVTVTFRESEWRRADGQPCTREHLLMALADVAVFMIRASYADNLAESSISDIQMDIAVPHSTGYERALEVEECACPQGYRGPSCQECDEGYTRTTSGLYLGTCERCDCNGHASSCDPETGRCLQCLHNTAGSRCERCQNGFYGDPVTGGAQACKPCPCPGISSNNQFSTTCYLDSDSQPTCDNCPLGFTGRRCERCAPGYTGNPLLGQSCKVGNGPDGKFSQYCSTCKTGAFHLSQENKDGCLSCFCMGVTQQCSSSTHYRDLVSSVFSPGNFQGFALVNRQRTSRISTGFTVEISTEGTQLSYSNFDYLGQEPHYWQLPGVYQGDKVGSYGGKLKYTISYVAGPRGTLLDDADVQIIGNDITLVARQPWQRRQQGREMNTFEIVFREENWRRPDGMIATREHLMMVLADLDDILIRASYSTEMRSSSISDISMEVAVPNYSGLAQALEVEQCRCPPGYQGLSCQDCAPGYTRTGGGLYLGHCELCECNGHSDSCHPETGICSSCLHNTQGELCEQCAPGFFGDPTVGTPEDCQPCACPHTDPDNQFSPTCESLGNGGYQCTACQPGYTGQYCERCAPGYVGNPQAREKSPLVVRIYPERVLVPQGNPVTLRCQVSGSPPHYFFWSREDGQPISSSADRRRQGAELYFTSVQSRDAGVYICTCQDQRGTNRSHAEIVVTSVPSKPIEVIVEEPKSQTIRVGSTVQFICTAQSKSPAYTLVWTRSGNGKLPNRAMDFNGILTIQNVQPEDAGVYICTGSNMFGMDEGRAILYVPEGARPLATVTPSVLNVYQGQRAEFHCTVTGNPTPAIEWIGGPGNRMSPRAVIRGGILTFTSVDSADEGDYTCKALNTHGEHTARVSLLVQSIGLGTLPQVQVSPQNTEVQEGDTLRLYCRASGSPTPKLTWLKNGGQIPPQARNDRTDIGTLFIPNIKVADSGTYMCVGSNSVGSNSAPIKVSASRAQSFLKVSVSSPAEKNIFISLLCLLVGFPAPEIKWTKLRSPLPWGNRIVNNSLVLQNVGRQDSGEYICSATNNMGTTEATITLDVESECLYFHCCFCSHFSESVWVCLYYSGFKLVLQSIVCYVLCVYANVYTALSKPVPTLFIFVIFFSTALPKVMINVRTSVQTVMIGNSVEFECQAVGDPEPTVKWSKVGGSLPPHIVVKGGMLKIEQVTEADAGQYRCTATNDVGELVTTPLFDGVESYIAYPPLTNIHDDLRVELEFKPVQRDGLMFFCGGKKMKVEDFVAISMVKGHVEFRYELGTGQAILVSPEPVSLGQWHRVVAERNMRDGHLRVDQGPVERKTSPGKAQGLNIQTLMYIGGVPNMDILPKPANVSDMFEGCIGEVRSLSTHHQSKNGCTHCHKHTAHVIQIFQKIKPIVHQTVCSQHAVLGGLTLNDYTCLTPALSPLYPAHTGQVVSFPEALRNLESSEANGTVSKYSVCLTRP
uniref:Heparan sulfate proteoglycan 2 n=1 Tax=Oreochromis niloticus TaxID=8128 RepID=A0A669DG86_ORENI